MLEENRPEPHEAIRADTAFVMTNLLRGVVQRGTAQAAAALDWPLAGKTGTMDEYTDAWFVGFDPNITVGVWVGYDEKKPLGSGETGATAALPIWMDFMRAYIDKRGDRKNPPEFEAPGNIVFVTLDSGVTEAFINGTQPQPAARAGGARLPLTPDVRARRSRRPMTVGAWSPASSRTQARRAARGAASERPSPSQSTRASASQQRSNGDERPHRVEERHQISGMSSRPSSITSDKPPS